jgi:hypothetical protein
MSRCYTVVKDDNLTVIARHFGLRGWRAIYDHPWNAAFRRRRPNPDLIHPGDILYVPDPNEATGTRSFDFIRRAVAAARIDIIEDTDDDHVVGATEPTAALVRIGLWDRAFAASGSLRNAVAEASNFIGRDSRRFYFRVRDPGAAGTTVSIEWRTLLANGSDDDAPANARLTLTQTAAGSKVFVSKAVMLVTNDLDAGQATNSGLPAADPDTGNRTRGQSNHRLRRARLDGMVRATYAPGGAASPVRVTRPVFSRSPEERRRLPALVINYGSAATAAYINGQFTEANRIWNAVGLQIDPGAATNRPVPAAATNGAGQYSGSHDNPQEVAAMADLLPITPDDTLTVVFANMTGSNAYTTVAQRLSSALGNRFFVFINVGLPLSGTTLAHELHHLIFNRFDTAVSDEFVSFNTTPAATIGTRRGIAIPDVRIRRRIHQQNNPTPNQDFCADNITNWYRRTRLTRDPALGSLAAADDTTGNTLVRPF